MKKLTISLLSIAMLVFATAPASSLNKIDPTRKTASATPTITYVVHVTAPANLLMCHSYFVSISDISGNLIANPQPYQDGVEDYIFHETGPFAGGRVANLNDLDILKRHVCGQKVYTSPDAIFHKFMNSTSYIFYLYPIIVPGDE